MAPLRLLDDSDSATYGRAGAEALDRLAAGEPSETVLAMLDQEMAAYVRYAETTAVSLRKLLAARAEVIARSSAS